MTFLVLQPLSADLLPAVSALDQRCFGGLWTLEGYRRELESPNSELLVLVEKAEDRRQKAEVGGQGEQGRQTAEGRLRREPSAERRQKSGEDNDENALPTTNNQKLTTASTQTPHPSPLIPYPSPLLGLACYWAILEEAHITMLAIDPAYQRQGLGQALLYALLASAHARGLERATLEVRVSNQAAIALYKKFAFREAGQRRRYYPDNSEDALVLWHNGLQTPEFSGRLTDWQQQVSDRLCMAGWQLEQDSDR